MCSRRILPPYSRTAPSTRVLTLCLFSSPPPLSLPLPPSPSSLIDKGVPGTAFTLEEREKFGLRGLLPPRVESIEQQAARSLSLSPLTSSSLLMCASRCLLQLSAQPTPIEQFNYLQQVKQSNETLFYHLLTHNLQKLCPLVYTPTVGQVPPPPDSTSSSSFPSSSPLIV